MIVAREHSPFFLWRVWSVKQRQKSLMHCSHCRPFRAKAYAIRTLLLCDWSAQQTATKPQTQWKGMLLGCEQPFLLGERCVSSQETAAEETILLVARLRIVLLVLLDDTVFFFIQKYCPF